MKETLPRESVIIHFYRSNVLFYQLGKLSPQLAPAKETRYDRENKRNGHNRREVGTRVGGESSK